MRETNTNELFPVFLKTKELSILLVGGGTVALEKLKALLLNSPDTPISVVSSEYTDAFIDFAERHESVFLEARDFEPSDIEGKQLIITALNDVVISEQIMHLANDSCARCAGVIDHTGDKHACMDRHKVASTFVPHK